SLATAMSGEAISPATVRPAAAIMFTSVLGQAAIRPVTAAITFTSAMACLEWMVKATAVISAASSVKPLLAEPPFTLIHRANWAQRLHPGALRRTLNRWT